MTNPALGPFLSPMNEATRIKLLICYCLQGHTAVALVNLAIKNAAAILSAGALPPLKQLLESADSKLQVTCNPSIAHAWHTDGVSLHVVFVSKDRVERTRLYRLSHFQRIVTSNGQDKSSKLMVNPVKSPSEAPCLCWISPHRLQPWATNSNAGALHTTCLLIKAGCGL